MLSKEQIENFKTVLEETKKATQKIIDDSKVTQEMLNRRMTI